MTPILEFAQFRLIPGADPAALTTAARAMGPWLAARPGYLARQLVQGPDGTWTDVVHWQSAEHAHAAGEALMQSPEAAPMMALIDPASVVLRHDSLVLVG
jgi:hypothetical protein